MQSPRMTCPQYYGLAEELLASLSQPRNTLKKLMPTRGRARSRPLLGNRRSTVSWNPTTLFDSTPLKSLRVARQHGRKQDPLYLRLLLHHRP